MESEFYQNDSYVPWPRLFRHDLRVGKLTAEEYLILSLLFSGANYFRGVACEGYAGLAEELHSTYTTNYINKIFISLRKKKYVDFKNHQGYKGMFEVKLDGFYLPGKKKTDIRKESKKTAGGVSAEVQAEVPTTPQKLEAINNSDGTRPTADVLQARGRSPKNENETEEYKETLTFPSKGRPVSDFSSEDERNEQRIRAIASELGIRDMAGLRRKCREHGIEPIEDAYNATCAGLDKGTVKNTSGYFFGLIKKFAEDGRSR